MAMNRGRFSVVQPYSTYFCTAWWRYYKMLNLKIGGFSVVGGETMHLSVPVRNLLWRRIIQFSLKHQKLRGEGGRYGGPD